MAKETSSGRNFKDKTTERSVLSLLNDAYAATAEFLDDAVVRDGLTDHWDRILRLERKESS
jgi:ribulose bisphosphate carboxylase small subunit